MSHNKEPPDDPADDLATGPMDDGYTSPRLKPTATVMVTYHHTGRMPARKWPAENLDFEPECSGS